MAKDSLQTLYRYEKDKEQTAANVLKKAQQHFQENQDRVDGISNYRLDYMNQLKQKAQTGIGSNTFSHYHSFVAKLDQALIKQKEAVVAAAKVVEQRRQQWLQQRQKVKAIEVLLEKKKQRQLLIENRNEQKMFDEIAIQGFIRKRA